MANKHRAYVTTNPMMATWRKNDKNCLFGKVKQWVCQLLVSLIFPVWVWLNDCTFYEIVLQTNSGYLFVLHQSTNLCFVLLTFYQSYLVVVLIDWFEAIYLLYLFYKMLRYFNSWCKYTVIDNYDFEARGIFNEFYNLS